MPIQDIVRNIPNIAFEVDDLEEALICKTIVYEISSPYKGVRTAKIVGDRALTELLEFRKKY